MWFAALGSYQKNPWLVHLAYKLLISEPEGNPLLIIQDQVICTTLRVFFRDLLSELIVFIHTVIRLMAPPPFNQPPQFIRARLFTYHFTEYNDRRSL